MDEMIRKLIEERARTWEQMKAVLDREFTEKRELDAEEREQTQRLTDDIQRLDARIDELHELNVSNKRADEQRAQYESVLAANAERRDTADSVELRMLKEMFAGKRNHIDIDIRGLSTRIDPSTNRWEVRDLITDVAGQGGNLVPTSFRRMLYEHLIENSAIRQTNVTVLTTAAGEDLQVPKTSTYGTAAIVGEGTALAETTQSFGQVTLQAWKYGAFTQVSRELQEDNAVDLIGFLARDLGRAVGNASGAHYITGTGTNQPYGVVNATIAQVGTAVAGTVASGVDSGELVSLQYAINAQYANRAWWLMRRATEGYIRRLRDSNYQFLWQPSMQLGAPNLLLGRPIVNDPNVAALGSGNSSIIFGDLSAYFIRDVGSVRVERSDDFAFTSDLSTWKVSLRTDGDLIDTSGAIALYVGD